MQFWGKTIIPGKVCHDKLKWSGIDRFEMWISWCHIVMVYYVKYLCLSCNIKVGGPLRCSGALMVKKSVSWEKLIFFVINLQRKEGIWSYIIIYNSIIYQEYRDIIVVLFCPPLMNVFAAVWWSLTNCWLLLSALQSEYSSIIFSLTWW